MQSRTDEYDRATVVMHWATAALAVLLWIIGQTADWIPDGPLNTDVWSVHVVVGFLFAVLVLGTRIVWRISGGRHLPEADRGLLRVLAKMAHLALYGLLIVVVTLGVVNAFVRGYNLFDLVSLPQIGDRALRKPITAMARIDRQHSSWTCGPACGDGPVSPFHLARRCVAPNAHGPVIQPPVKISFMRQVTQRGRLRHSTVAQDIRQIGSRSRRSGADQTFVSTPPVDEPLPS